MIPTTHGILQQKQVVAAYLSVSPTIVRHSYTAGTSTFNIIASGSWYLAEFGKILWISENYVSGTGNTTVTITFIANTVGDTREADITVTQGGLTATVHVIQDAFPI
jgi:hypothetical protein